MAKEQYLYQISILGKRISQLKFRKMIKMADGNRFLRGGGAVMVASSVWCTSGSVRISQVT